MVQFRGLVYISSLSSSFTLQEHPGVSRGVTFNLIHWILPWTDINKNCNIFFQIYFLCDTASTFVELYIDMHVMSTKTMHE